MVEEGPKPTNGITLGVSIDRLEAMPMAEPLRTLLEAWRERARREAVGPDPRSNAVDEAAVGLAGHWWVHEQRAESLLDAGDLDAAMSAATVAQRLAPRAAATRVASAAVLVRQQDHPGARRLLQVASEHAGLWPSVRARARSALAQD